MALLGSGAPALPDKCNAMGCRSHVQLAPSGQLPEGRGRPAHLLHAKVTGVLPVPSVQPLISFIDPFSMGVV